MAAVTDRASGFTLLEVLLALFLMIVALIAAAPLFAYAMRGTATGADLGSIGARAVDRMEVLRESDFNALAAGGSLTTDLTGYSDISDARFTIRWEIVPNGSPATLKTIGVRAIAMRTTSGLQKEIVLTTVRAR